ncbi:MAG: peptidoglycan DD-metalloendopeptidase family protein [Dysgonamonadaceae bacterium]|jgi:murein DD-endopeptidase MepM/ murein hydrolase activator NlpD|nr:peptidoglycan DD-metalloendopeptidase family protein [Dysgonamonadaceae bacterium]
MSQLRSDIHANLIVTGHTLETKIFRIKRKYIENFELYKKIGICVVAVVCIAVSGLFYGLLRANSKKKSLETNIAKLESQLYDKTRQKKAQAIMDNLNEAQSTLEQIENYLNSRSVETRLNSEDADSTGIGGEFFPETDASLNLSEDRLDRISDLFHKISYVPLGTPCNGRMTSTFGVRSNPMGGDNNEFHSGIDWAGRIGSKISSTASGTVKYAGYQGNYGLCVIIKHDFGYETLYGHLSELKVREGQQVKTGEVIGLLGNTGRSNGPHVHYEIIHNGRKINPVNFIKMN